MTRELVVKMLYRGGMAAIAAEMIVILGIVLIAAVAPEIAVNNSIDQDNFFAYQDFTNAVQAHSTIYMFSTILISLFPSILMMFVIWTFHHYFAYEGVQFMHWVATGIGIVGVGLMLLFTVLDVAALPSISAAIHRGDITYQQGFPALAIVGGVFDGAAMVLYGGYPLLLLYTSFEKRLLPRWFMLAAMVFAILNDLNMFYGYQSRLLSDLSAIVVVMWPFLLGVVLLRKAQTLAEIAYTEKHGTPPHPRTPTTAKDHT